MLFDDIKSITIPEGMVSKILCNGITIWKKAEKPSPEPIVDLILKDSNGEILYDSNNKRLLVRR